MVGLGRVEDPAELAFLRGMLEKHVGLTDSALGLRILERWGESSAKLVKVLPHDYRRMQEALTRLRARGLPPAEAEMAAFEENARDEARVSGN